MTTYLLHRTLCNMGFPTLTVSRAVDVLQGRHQTDDEDQAEDDGPGWDDSSTWGRGPGLPEAPSFARDDDGARWLAGLPTDEDLEAMPRHAAWLDHMDAIRHEDDARH